MRETSLGYPVTIDGIEYPSLSAASKALGISRDRLTYRVAEHGRVLTSDDIAIKRIPKPAKKRPDKAPPKVETGLSWAFVYRQISSSPKQGGVDSTAVLHAA